MRKIQNRLKHVSTFIMVLVLGSNNSVYASNDGQLCSGLAKLICMPIALIDALSSDTSSSDSKIHKTIKDADLPGLKKLLEDHPNEFRPYQLLGWALESYETGNQEEKRLKVLTYLLQQKIDFVGPSQKYSNYTSTEYYLLAQTLIEDFYVSSHPKKRKYTLQATTLFVSYGFTFHPTTENVIGEDPRERYAKIIQKLSPADKELESTFYKLLTENALSQTPTTHD